MFLGCHPCSSTRHQNSQAVTSSIFLVSQSFLVLCIYVHSSGFSSVSHSLKTIYQLLPNGLCLHRFTLSKGCFLVSHAGKPPPHRHFSWHQVFIHKIMGSEVVTLFRKWETTHLTPSHCCRHPEEQKQKISTSNTSDQRLVCICRYPTALLDKLC